MRNTETLGLCKDRVRKVKDHLQLSLVRDVKDKKGFYGYISSKRETVGLLLKRRGDLVTKDLEEACILNVAFVFVILISPTFSNPRPLRLIKTAKAGKTYSHWRRTSLGNI